MKKLLYITLAVAVAAVAASVTFDGSELTEPPPRTGQDGPLHASTSTVIIPLGLKLSTVREHLDKELPETLYTFEKRAKRALCVDHPADDSLPAQKDSRRSCMDVNFTGSVTRNGGVDLWVEREQLVVAVPARGEVVARGTGAISKLLYKTARGEFTVTFRGTLTRTADGNLDLLVSSEHHWDVPVNTKVLGREIDLRKPVDKYLRKGLDKLEQKVSEVARDQARWAENLQGVYQKLVEPVRVAEDPDVWLVVTPQRLHLAGIVSRDDELVLPIGVEAELRTHVGDRPTPPPAVEMPAIEIHRDWDPSFTLELPVVLGYEYLRSELDRELVGMRVPVARWLPGAAVVIKALHLYPSGEQLVVGVDFTTVGLVDWLSARGSVYLIGTPEVEDLGKVLTVRDLSFTRRTNNPILNLGTSLLADPLRSVLQSQTRFEIAEYYDEVVRDANAALNHTYAGGITLKGRFDQVRINQFQMRRHDLVVYAEARGQLEAVRIQ